MYVTDSENRTILAFDYNGETGEISRRKVFVTVDPGLGLPDGLTVDAEGYVWSAHWNGWRVTRYAPDGRTNRVLSLPVPRPTSCIFGGDSLDRLYVTSASVGLSSTQLASSPLSGGLFEIEVGVQGMPELSFRG